MYTNEHQTNYTIIHSIFRDNSAENGGVMYVLNNSNIEVGTGTYIENHATDKGGVFYIRGGTLVVDVNSVFSGNTATSGDVISTCLSDVNVADIGLEMQPDPEYPQYCSVYDETNVTTMSNTEVTSESAVSTAPAMSTTVATQTELTTPSATSHEDTTTSGATEDSSTTKTSGDVGTPESLSLIHI